MVKGDKRHLTLAFSLNSIFNLKTEAAIFSGNNPISGLVLSCSGNAREEGSGGIYLNQDKKTNSDRVGKTSFN